MKIIGKLLRGIGAVMAICLTAGVIVSRVENKKGWTGEHEPAGLYEREIKRALDFGLSLSAAVFLWPVMLVTGVAVRKKLGAPVLFTQKRPGLNEKIFLIKKFRTMTDQRNEDGELLADEIRLTKFGRWLRSTSLDELPELFNILNGDMSIVGPRPQLVRDMVFMSGEHRKRHEVRPGLTGLAQVHGRNGIPWTQKLDMDLEYCRKITFSGDLKIIFQTVLKVFEKEGITGKGQATAPDYGDWLLLHNKVSREEYEERQREAERLLAR